MADGNTYFEVYPRNSEDNLKPILVKGTHFNWCVSECTLDIYDGEELVAVFHLRDVIGVAQSVMMVAKVEEGERGTWRLLNGVNA